LSPRHTLRDGSGRGDDDAPARQLAVDAVAGFATHLPPEQAAHHAPKVGPGAVCYLLRLRLGHGVISADLRRPVQVRGASGCDADGGLGVILCLVMYLA